MPPTVALRPPARAGLPPLIVACLAATWLIWGSTYLAIKWALVSFPPFFQMGTRFVAAGMLLGAYARLARRPWPDAAANGCSAFVLGAMMLGGGYGATALAQVSVSSGLVVAFIAVVPALVALVQWPYGVRPSRLEAAGIALGLAGVLLLTRARASAASLPGLLAIALACVTWSLGSVWALTRAARWPPAGAGARRRGLRQPDAGRRPAAAGRLRWLAGEQPRAAARRPCAGELGLPRGGRLAGRLLGLHGAAAAHQRRAGVELHLRQPGDRAWCWASRWAARWSAGWRWVARASSSGGVVLLLAGRR